MTQDPITMVGIITQVLVLCGLVSVRFLPVFLYYLLVWLAPNYPDCWLVSDLIQHQAEHASGLVSPTFLTVLGVLSVVELVAMRVPDVKDLWVEYKIDKYVKFALSALVSFDLMTSAQSSEVKELLDSAVQLQAASFGSNSLTAIVIVAGLCITWSCYRIRSAVLELIQTIDPENDFGLQSISNWLGEISLIVIFLLLLFLATAWLAYVLTLIVILAGYCFQCLLGRHERKHSHLCAACTTAGKETLVSDCALICPECGTEQPDVRRVGLFGFSGTSPLAGMSSEQHAFSLLSAHRCRWCASPLDRSHVCPRCRREQWTKKMLTYYVGQTDRWSETLMGVALLIAPLARIVLRQWAIRPLNVHLRTGDRFLIGLWTTFFKLLLLPILLPLCLIWFLWSAIPFLGFPTYLPSIWRYKSVRANFMRTIEQHISISADEQLKLKL